MSIRRVDGRMRSKHFFYLFTQHTQIKILKKILVVYFDRWSCAPQV